MTHWIAVAKMGQLIDEVGYAVETEAGRVGLFLLDGRVFACQDICPHGQAYLSDGFVENCQIECPLHQGRFDLRTGEATAPPVQGRIRTFPVEIRDGEVFINLDQNVDT
jgi:naphthalene 1,2-dioxygenase system ferredoxin subunit